MTILHITGILLLICIPVYAEEPMIIAHRGASRDAPENTMPAFKLAWEQGADAIEGDFHLTRDGHIVCIHDYDTKRVSDRNFVISKSTLAELRKLDVGAYRGKNFKGIVIPTIAEVFSSIPEQKKIYIEIKCGAKIIPVLLEEIKKSGLKREQIVVICFNEKVIQELKAKAPQFKAFWLSGFKENKSGKAVPSPETVLKTLKQTEADGFSSSKDIISEPFIRSVMEHGYEYHVWTVDDLKTAKRFKKWGANSITTNVPGYMKKNLVEQDAPADADKPRR
jgi:glycerophosphoryl diester phosphodiesterase